MSEVKEVRSVAVKENADSLVVTFRKNKEGQIVCTGFDAKVYHDASDPAGFEAKLNNLIELGKKKVREAGG